MFKRLSCGFCRYARYYGKVEYTRADLRASSLE